MLVPAHIAPPPKKAGVVFLPKGLVKATSIRKVKPVSTPKQMFFATFSDTAVMVKYQDITFGIRKNADIASGNLAVASKYDSHINGTVSAGDGDYIRLIQAILRKRIAAGKTHEEIVTELNTVAGFSSSVRIFHSRICEPVVKEPKPVRETIKKNTVFVPEKRITNFKKACEIMHSQTTLQYILFEKVIYYFPKKKGVIDPEKTTFKIKDMVD